MPLSLIVFIVICFAAALVGGVFTRSSVKTWYPTIQKPSWNPPNWIFGPVWSMLYLCMAVAAWRVWNVVGGQIFSTAIVLFFIQLLLNTLWSVIFFGMRNLVAAFFEIVLLWFLIALTMGYFWFIDSLAGILFVPYLLWVSFAVYLNFTIVKLNIRN